MDPALGYVPFDLLPILGIALLAALMTCWLEQNLVPSPRRREWGGVFALLFLAVYLYTTSASGLGRSGAGGMAGPKGDAWTADSAASRPPEMTR